MQSLSFGVPGTLAPEPQTIIDFLKLIKMQTFLINIAWNINP